jgi:hypothetical protein
MYAKKKQFKIVVIEIADIFLETNRDDIKFLTIREQNKATMKIVEREVERGKEEGYRKFNFYNVNDLKFSFGLNGVYLLVMKK